MSASFKKPVSFISFLKFDRKSIICLGVWFDAYDKSGRNTACKISCISVKLCEFPTKKLTPVAVYGLGAESMLLLSNLKIQEKKRLCHIVAKVYLMRWRIEEYFKFKKQQFELEDLRLMSLQSIRSLNLPTTLATGYISLTSSVHSESIFLKKLKECSRRVYEVPKFLFYSLGYAIERVLSMSRNGINSFFPPKVRSQQPNLFEHFKIEDSGAFVF